MWTLVFRKLINNKWMMLCLLFGFIVVVSMVSAVPMYSNAVLQKMLQEDLADYQSQHSSYAGLYEIDGTYNSKDKTTDAKEKAYRAQDEDVTAKTAEFGDLIVRQVRRSTAQNMIITPDEANDPDNETKARTSASVYTVSDLENHIEVTHGRIYEDTDDGVFEAIVTEEAYNNLGLTLDGEYRLSSVTDKSDYICFRVVGVFTIGDLGSNFWYVAGGVGQYTQSIIFRESDYLEIVFDAMSSNYMYKSEWRSAIDYQSMHIEDLDRVIASLQSQIAYFTESSEYSYVNCTMLPTLISYTARAQALKINLWVILVPILVMLALYIFMVAQIIIKNDEDEIAVMRSRGASGKQIFETYLLESIVLGGAALAVGPPLSFLLCRVMGSANGFLEFVNRSGLPVRLIGDTYIYAAAAVIFFVLMMLIPALGASRSSIVERKRKRSRFADVPIWKKFFIDIITLGISIYGYYNYKNYSSLLQGTGGSAMETQIDPLLFLISSLFIIGAGLLFLRIYPYIIRLIFFIGRRKWSPTVYAAFIHVGRSSGQEQFLMLFLVLAVAVGVFSANAARTLNQNIVDRISYSNGSDVVLNVEWETEEAYDLEGHTIEGEYVYIEPDFQQYRDIEGVESAARVYMNTAKVQSQKNKASSSGVSLMALSAPEFADTAWTRNDLFYPYSINAYLQLLNEAPRGALISKGLADNLGVVAGDIVNVTLNDDATAPLIVYAVVDYWPSLQPYHTGGFRWDDAENGVPAPRMVYDNFLIMNLTYVQTKFTSKPYSVWLHKDEGVTDTEIFNYVEAHPELRVKSINYIDQEIMTSKNDPQLQGFNGMLTLGFIITMCICILGFLIYWVISIRSRTMQFGVFRAMGMPFSGIVTMMLVEQVLISLVSILVGFTLGGFASEMFVPMLELVYSIDETVPGFVVVMLRSDYLKIYAVIGVMLVAGVLVLARLISRTRMDQALKLGED